MMNLPWPPLAVGRFGVATVPVTLKHDKIRVFCVRGQRNTIKHEFLAPPSHKTMIKYELLAIFEHENTIKHELLASLSRKTTIKYELLVIFDHEDTIKHECLASVDHKNTITYD